MEAPLAVTFRQLKYFLVLSEELHFSRAAEKLNISQPPLSASLRQLEERLGFKLMERTSKYVRLTPAGTIFADQAARILGQLDSAMTIAAETAKGAAGELSVGFVPSMLFRDLPAKLKAFQNSHPRVDLILHEMNTTRQIESLLEHKIDVGFVHAVPLPNGISHKVLETERLVACVPRWHRLASKSRIRISELAGERMMVFSRSFAAHYHDKITALLRTANLEPDTSFHIQHWFTVVALVKQGMGVSLVPSSLSSSVFSDVVFLEVEERQAEHDIAQIWRSDNTSPMLQNLLLGLPRFETRL
ncbi:LysR family transcriptional regulator [Antarcticimicrobium sediminis]|uniref:LysR family transcriptional regulator n=1 Tax=Antarcticimicrobium sediminis TaxID=2546227 RepID=A0A4R5EJF2_9RHOB|nr:LysR family transcriptional regulator [Antarcticimicrobium sediminis]TDE34669.1 LysR family transcriptional regulator [Antarcticimicrobium sediminis]